MAANSLLVSLCWKHILELIEGTHIVVGVYYTVPPLLHTQFGSLFMYFLKHDNWFIKPLLTLLFLNASRYILNTIADTLIIYIHLSPSPSHRLLVTPSHVSPFIVTLTLTFAFRFAFVVCICRLCL